MKKEKTVDISRELLDDYQSGCRHRRDDRFFTRNRILTFGIVAMLILKKSMKSLQLILNGFSGFFNLIPVTCSAFTQARSHLSHTAFIELNEKAIVSVVYEDGNYKRYGGKFRLSGIDGSEVILPNEENVRQEFGAINYTDGRDDQIAGSKPQATASVLYDVLNHVAIDSIPGHPRAYEVTSAEKHLCHTRENDLILTDRNYTTYRFSGRMIVCGRDFAGRCPENSFGVVREMSEGKGKDSRIVTLKPSDMKEAEDSGLPPEITVRFVRAILDTGGTEVSVTSLPDESTYPTEDFKSLYNMRWGVETFYGVLKTGLCPENFTGKTAESVKQDFYAAIYITGSESVLTRDVNEKLEKKTCQSDPDRGESEKRSYRHQYKVNKAVPFNAIKNHISDLFYPENRNDVISDKPENMFGMNTTCVRKNRKTERKKHSPDRVLNYHKRVKKICY
jgi:hypothetical protein